MENKPCGFVWHELATSDTKAATDFYGHVLGWTAVDSGMGGPGYTFVRAGDRNVGGTYTLPEELVKSGARPSWTGYLGVADAKQTLARVQELGGRVVHDLQTIPGVGVIGHLADPYGAVFAIIQPEPIEGPPPVALNTPGHVGWNELHAGDGVKAFAFYSELFGWTKADAMDMGPMGVYQLFAAGAEPIGGVMTKMPDMPAAMWLFYFNVDSATAAIERVKAHGGQLLMGPHEVPGSMWIANFFDPQGAMFSVVSKDK
ncbi:MAG: VOC family protein [Candidatus Eisenbacteria bacterium]